MTPKFNNLVPENPNRDLDTGTRNEISDRQRSITIAGHKTSVSLEEEFWEGLKEIAAVRHLGL